MCQLLGMNCNVPTDIVFSFEGFRKRGGLTDHHTDGFGIGFFEGKGLRLFLDNDACAHSAVADLVQQYPIKSLNVISHIRKGTQGTVKLENTHPFQREMWGKYWLFAHNGHLKNLDLVSATGEFKAVGDTDSELAFCYILNELKKEFVQQPDDQTLFQALVKICQKVREYGMFNVILSNGEFMFTHTSTLLYYIIRQAPFGAAHLIDDDLAIDFSEVTTPNDRVAVIATLPLTHNETWQQMACNESAFFKEGCIIYRDCPDIPQYLTKEEGLQIARSVGVSL